MGALLALALVAGCTGLGGEPTAAPRGLPEVGIFSTTGAGGVICRGGAPAGSGCDPAAPGAGASAGDTIRADAQGTVGAQSQAVKIRLLPAATLQLQARANLGLAQRFLLETGQALFDHANAAGEIEVQARSLRIQPLDTGFSVRADTDGGVTVAAISGAQGLVVTTTVGLGSGTATRQAVMHLGAGQEMEADPAGNFMGVRRLSAATQQIWATYAPALDLKATPRPLP